MAPQPVRHVARPPSTVCHRLHRRMKRSRLAVMFWACPRAPLLKPSRRRTVLFTFLTARLVTRNSATALLAAAIAAFTPGFAFISGTVNNDNAVAFLGAFIIWHCVRLLRAEGVHPRMASFPDCSWEPQPSDNSPDSSCCLWWRHLAVDPLARTKWQSEEGDRGSHALNGRVSGNVAWWPVLMREDWAQIQVNSSNNFQPRSPATGKRL